MKHRCSWLKGKSTNAYNVVVIILFSMAAYAELEKGREAVQPLFTSVPNSSGIEIETEQMPMAKSVPNV